MRRLVVLALIAGMLVSAVPRVAHGGHGHGAPVAAGIAAVLFAPFFIAGSILAAVVPPYRPPVVVEPAPVYRVETVRYVTAPAAAPASAERNVVRYAHGRYVLRGDGVATPYQWVWIPNAPPPPPPPPRPVSP